MGYRILSLDGGGAWALIQVRALIELYDANTTGHQVLADFDLAAANSGGSLVLGGLVENLPLSQILSYFEDEAKRKSIFSPTSSWGDQALHALTGIGPKYSEKAKLPAIERLLPQTGAKSLSEAARAVVRAGKADPIRLLIIGFDYDRNRAAFFRSTVAKGPQWGEGEPWDEVTLAEAVHASANPPVNYFDAPAIFPGKDGRYWDGGLTGCNNPVLAAVTEAIVAGQNPADIIALTVGTATVALPWPKKGEEDSLYVQKKTDQGLVADLRKLATSILDDPPDVASFLAHVMTGGQTPSRIVRMNPLIGPKWDKAKGWVAPAMTPAQFSYLVDMDMDAIDQGQVDAISAFTGLWIAGGVDNQPLRMNGDTLELEVGDRTFAAAKASWGALKALP